VTSVHEPTVREAGDEVAGGAGEPRVHLQRKVPGAVSAGVRSLAGGRRAVWVEFDDSVHKGALSSAASQVLTNAANTARDKRLPLVLSMASSGADILEGGARDYPVLGRGADRCHRARPGGVGASTSHRVVRRDHHDERLIRIRVGPDDGGADDRHRSE
jgi:hypothetical protein